MSRADVFGFSGRQRVIYGRNGLHFQHFFVRISASMALLFLPGKAAMDERAVWKGKGAYERKTFIGFAAATDALHEIGDFHTDYEFITKQQMKTIQKLSKGRK